MTGDPADAAPRAWLLADPERARTLLFGLDLEERLQRSLRAAGVERVERWSGPPGPLAGPQLVLRADLAFDDRLLPALVRQRDVVLVAPVDPRAGKERPAAACVDAERLPAAVAALSGAGEAEALRDPALRTLRPGDLSAHDTRLRRADPPFVFEVAPGNAREVERRIFEASYKGVTDLVTRFVWPAPALAVTRWLAARGVRPNMVTALSWLLVAAATLVFAAGLHGLGLGLAWLMTFLDTVDGKLARVTLTSSRLGHVLDHGLDLLHPPVWYWAFAAGLASDAFAGLPVLEVVVGGYVAGRLLEGAFTLAFGFETHSWRPVDSWFRTVTARRNPNLVLLSAATLVGRPDLGLAAVAAWTLASLGFHGVRLLQALDQRRRGVPVGVWYAPASGGGGA